MQVAWHRLYDSEPPIGVDGGFLPLLNWPYTDWTGLVRNLLRECDTQPFDLTVQLKDEPRLTRCVVVWLDGWTDRDEVEGDVAMGYFVLGARELISVKQTVAKMIAIKRLEELKQRLIEMVDQAGVNLMPVEEYMKRQLERSSG